MSDPTDGIKGKTFTNTRGKQRHVTAVTKGAIWWKVPGVDGEHWCTLKDWDRWKHGDG